LLSLVSHNTANRIDSELALNEAAWGESASGKISNISSGEKYFSIFA